jgi:hypothetical protein
MSLAMVGGNILHVVQPNVSHSKPSLTSPKPEQTQLESNEVFREQILG